MVRRLIFGKFTPYRVVVSQNPVNRQQHRILDASPTVLLGMRIGELPLTAAHDHQLTFPGRWKLLADGHAASIVLF